MTISGEPKRGIGVVKHLILIASLIGGLPLASAESPSPTKTRPPAVGVVIGEAFAWCANGHSCLCFEPLGCKGSDCSTIESHLEGMQKLLSGKKKGMSFICQYAETGTCGNWKYLYCDMGETQGRRLRFFDESGRLAATKEESDYGEFCGGKAMKLYRGQIPQCAPLKRTKIIYGKSGSTPLAPASEKWLK